MTGEVASASLHYIVRDHDASLFEARKNTLRHIEKIMNEKWGEGTVLAVTGSGKTQELKINFPEVGLKKLLASVAPIEKK